MELPAWLPSERTVSAFVVLILALTIALLAAGRGDRTLLGAGSNAVPTKSNGQVVAQVEAPRPKLGVAATPEAPAVGGGALLTPAPAIEYATAPLLATPPPDPAYDPMVDGLLPHFRILTYYGHPHDANMGIVGEHAIEDVHRLLIEEAERYEIADPDREVIAAFELIATVAQRVPGADGTYILDTDIKTLTEWVNYAADHDMLVFLDVQIGRGSVAAELEKVRSLLLRPNVHLAIDPEFAVADGQTPGDHIGSVWAESITYAQNELAALVEAHNLPPKVLIVHQFREDMIKEKETLRPVPGVQLVIDADGFGDPDLKTSVYNILVRDEPVEFGGIKLFYRQDKPLMEPSDVVDLNPSPDLVIYQ
ncbi:MAG: hypothetical protein H0V24_04255 [Chloroflexia bacterium]|nr:hypothetical protein [Chloroflexia bacterium]MDQ3412701.1 hypothetical protein [Chloroflexota bacterium]